MWEGPRYPTAFAMPGPPFGAATWPAKEDTMRATPLQTVKKSFEAKAKLVEQLVPMVDKQHGDTTDAEVKSRLSGLSNKKLLRLYKVEQKVRERFGDRAKLVQAIVDARVAAGLTADATFRAHLDGLPKTRLLDMANEKHGKRPAKMTAEQKARARRGRKAKERAKSAQKK